MTTTTMTQGCGFYGNEIAKAYGAFVSETAEIEFRLQQITP